MATTQNNKNLYRSPISTSINNDYVKKEYNTSFTLNKSKGKLYSPSEFNQYSIINHKRHNSSRHETLGSRYMNKNYIRKSPQKLAYHPSSASNSDGLL